MSANSAYSALKATSEEKSDSLQTSESFLLLDSIRKIEIRISQGLG